MNGPTNTLKNKTVRIQSHGYMSLKKKVLKRLRINIVALQTSPLVLQSLH